MILEILDIIYINVVNKINVSDLCFVIFSCKLINS